MSQQQQANEELHQMTIDALRRLEALSADVVSTEDIRLLAWHAGVDYDKEVSGVASN